MTLEVDNLKEFQSQKGLNFSVATNAKVYIDPYIQNQITHLDQNPDEKLSVTSILDTSLSQTSNLKTTIISIAAALLVVILIFGFCCYLGCFKKKSPEQMNDRYKKEGREETGFDDKESSKMLEEQS